MNRTTHPLCAGIVLAAAACTVPVAATTGPIQADDARVYATVVGANGNPVPRLTAADFAVLENGAEKRVLSAALSTDPMSVEIITDRLGRTPEFTPDQMRAGLMAFVHTLVSINPDTQISLRTFDSEAVQLVKPTSSVARLESVIRKTFTNNGNAVLLDAIADASEDLQRAPNRHRIVIGLVAGYKGDSSSISSLAAAQRLRQSGASFWALEAVATGVSNPARDVMLNQATRDSGGMHTTVSIGTAIEAAAARLAVLALAQYEIRYAAPANTANRRIDVSVKTGGVNVLAPHWTPDR
jgi:hypothetical protein